MLCSYCCIFNKKKQFYILYAFNVARMQTSISFWSMKSSTLPINLITERLTHIIPAYMKVTVATQHVMTNKQIELQYFIKYYYSNTMVIQLFFWYQIQYTYFNKQQSLLNLIYTNNMFD